jgi:hypothetical protein
LAGRAEDPCELLRNEFYRGDETVPHIPDPGELPQMMPQNPAT